MKQLKFNEVNQVIDVLLPFLNENIDFLPNRIMLDDLQDKAPCLALIQEPDTYQKVNENVIGSFDGLFSFDIFYKIKGQDTNSRKEATKLLNSIALFFEQSKETGNLPEINQEDTIQSIDLTVTPHLEGRDNSQNYVYSASFTLRYHHKSKYEK